MIMGRKMIREVCGYIFDKTKVLMIPEIINKQEFWAPPHGTATPGERLENCISRVLEEQTGLKCVDLKQMGMIFFNRNWEDQTTLRYVYIASQFSGVLRGSEKGNFPEWIDRNRFPDLTQTEEQKRAYDELKHQAYFQLILEYRQETLTEPELIVSSKSIKLPRTPNS